MKPEREIVFTTRSITVGEMINAHKVRVDNDVTALVRLLVARSDITEGEMLLLDGHELEELTKAFSKSIEQSNKLFQLGRLLPGEVNRIYGAAELEREGDQLMDRGAVE